MNVTVFEAINITKKYRNTLALNQVSMSVMQGDIYGFIGENGAGKTTITGTYENFLIFLINSSPLIKGSIKSKIIKSGDNSFIRSIAFAPVSVKKT